MHKRRRMNLSALPGIEKEEVALLEEETIPLHDLVLYNDDVNTFEFVIESLIRICSHDPLQAEQCAYLVHYKGKSAVKRGSSEKLTPLCTALLDRGLSAKIE